VDAIAASITQVPAVIVNIMRRGPGFPDAGLRFVDVNDTLKFSALKQVLPYKKC